MAIYNGRILMRKGNEADFDASKLYAGEWAVSLDAGIVRICLEAGKVIRMATYEAFEEDMKQVEAILLECQTIEEAVQRINTEINAKVDAVVEYVGQAKTYRDEAKTFRDEAEAFKNQAGEIAGIDIATTEKAGIVKPDGETIRVDEDGTIHADAGTVDYTELENKPKINGVELEGDKSLEELGLNTEMEITETASGEEIRLTDSAEGKAVEFALFGKARQNTTSGKNLLENTATSQELNGVIFTVNEDKSITVKGTATSSTTVKINTLNNDEISKLNGYILSGGTNNCFVSVQTKSTYTTYATSRGSEAVINVSTAEKVDIYCRIQTGSVVDETIYPMISVNGGEYEPYTNGASPNPEYPQEIEVSGESYNLLENTATSQTINGVEFVVNEDKSISVSGTATNVTSIDINTVKLPIGNYKFSSNGEITSDKIVCFVQGINGTSDWIFGTERDLTLTQESDIRCRIYVWSGATVNTTYYPMIRKASVTNDRYMPYGKGSVEVKSVGKNLLNIDGTRMGEDEWFITGNDGKLIRSYTSAELFGRYTFTSQNGHLNITVHNSLNYLWLSRFIELKPNTDYFASNKTSKTFKIFGLDSKEVNTSGVQIGGLGSFNSGSYKYYMIGFYGTGEWYPQIELGNIATEFQPCKETLSTIPTNGLAGIKVSSGGNYTDQNGQQWICDEVVKYADGSGAFIQRVENIELPKEMTNYTVNSADGELESFFTLKVDNLIKQTTSAIKLKTISTHFRYGNPYSEDGELLCAYVFSSGGIRFRINGVKTLNELSTWLDTNDVKVLYELYEPITTPLTAEEIAEISTFYPITNISNDFDCGMSVKYVGEGIITTNTEIPVVAQDGELESGDNVTTLFGKVKRKLDNTSVVDNLLSTSTTLPLSANQGRVLDEKIGTINESLQGLKLTLVEYNQTLVQYNNYVPYPTGFNQENTIVVSASYYALGNWYNAFNNTSDVLIFLEPHGISFYQTDNTTINERAKIYITKTD